MPKTSSSRPVFSIQYRLVTDGRTDGHAATALYCVVCVGRPFVDAARSRIYETVVRPSACLSVRPSVTSRYCIEKTGRLELVFGMEASFHLSHTVL